MIRLRDVLKAGQACQVARTQHARPMSEHVHDFSELFWIEQGTGWHVINGRRESLRPGQLILIRPSDCHGFRLAGRTTFTIVNIAFATAVLEELRSRYFQKRHWPWEGGDLPATYDLAPSQIERLRAGAEQLSIGNAGRLELDCFLLNMLQMLTRSTASTEAGPLPDWLNQALIEFAQPPHLSAGVRGLAELADRSPEHVSRTIRRCFGHTATQYVNDLRLQYAARQLRMTSDPILQIAGDAGFENVGYFYRRFKQRFETTPRRFRLREQVAVR